MNGWQILIWGGACITGAVIFLTIVSRSIMTAEQRLRALAHKEQHRLALWKAARAMEGEELAVEESASR